MKKIFTSLLLVAVAAFTANAKVTDSFKKNWTDNMVISLNRILVGPSQSEVQQSLDHVTVTVEGFTSLNNNIMTYQNGGVKPIDVYKIKDGVDITADGYVPQAGDLTRVCGANGDYDYAYNNVGYIMFESDLAKFGDGQYLIDVPEGQFGNNIVTATDEEGYVTDYYLAEVTPAFQLIYTINTAGYEYVVRSTPEDGSTVDEIPYLTVAFENEWAVQPRADEYVYVDDYNSDIRHYCAKVYKDGVYYCEAEYQYDEELTEQQIYNSIDLVPYHDGVPFVITEKGTYTFIINKGDLYFGDMKQALRELDEDYSFTINVTGNNYDPSVLEGIDAVGQKSEAAPVFGLNGVRVATPAQGGVYIQGGKKILK